MTPEESSAIDARVREKMAAREAADFPEASHSRSYLDTDPIAPRPPKSLAVVREAEPWTAAEEPIREQFPERIDHSSDDVIPDEDAMPDKDFTKDRRKRTSAPIRLTCEGKPGQFTVAQAADMAGVQKITVYTAIKRGFAVGAARLMFRTIAPANGAPVAKEILTTAEPRNLVCDQIPGEKFCVSAAERTADVSPIELLQALHDRAPVGKDRPTFRRKDAVVAGKPAQIIPENITDPVQTPPASCGAASVPHGKDPNIQAMVDDLVQKAMFRRDSAVAAARKACTDDMAAIERLRRLYDEA